MEDEEDECEGEEEDEEAEEEDGEEDDEDGEDEGVGSLMIKVVLRLGTYPSARPTGSQNCSVSN